MKVKHGEHPAGDAAQVVALGIFLVVWLMDSLVLHKSTFLSARVPLYVRLGAALAVLAGSVSLVRAGHAVIDHAQGPAGVVSTGAFGCVRHPLYLGCVLFYAGLFLATLSIVSGALVSAIFALYNYLATYEERFLETKFGEAYRSYKTKTGKWLPRLLRA